jgi:hypothetical protein
LPERGGDRVAGLDATVAEVVRTDIDRDPAEGQQTVTAGSVASARFAT